MKLSELSPAKWRPVSSFFAGSVVFEVDVIPLNTIFVPVVSALVTTGQSKNEVKWKLSLAPMNRPSVVS